MENIQPPQAGSETNAHWKADATAMDALYGEDWSERQNYGEFGETATNDLDSLVQTEVLETEMKRGDVEEINDSTTTGALVEAELLDALGGLDIGDLADLEIMAELELAGGSGDSKGARVAIIKNSAPSEVNGETMVALVTVDEQHGTNMHKIGAVLREDNPGAGIEISRSLMSNYDKYADDEWLSTVSGKHLTIQVRAEGFGVRITDSSTNGTSLTRSVERSTGPESEAQDGIITSVDVPRSVVSSVVEIEAEKPPLSEAERTKLEARRDEIRNEILSDDDVRKAEVHSLDIATMEREIRAIHEDLHSGRTTDKAATLRIHGENGLRQGIAEEMSGLNQLPGSAREKYRELEKEQSKIAAELNR